MPSISTQGIQVRAADGSWVDADARNIRVRPADPVVSDRRVTIGGRTLTGFLGAPTVGTPYYFVAFGDKYPKGYGFGKYNPASASDRQKLADGLLFATKDAVQAARAAVLSAFGG